MTSFKEFEYFEMLGCSNLLYYYLRYCWVTTLGVQVLEVQYKARIQN